MVAICLKFVFYSLQVAGTDEKEYLRDTGRILRFFQKLFEGSLENFLLQTKYCRNVKKIV